MAYKYDPFQHCCSTMNARLDPECYTNQLPLLEYEPDLRSYNFIIRFNGGESYGTRLPLFFCPWCGKELPEDLDGIWGQILENEYGLTEEERDNGAKVPEEFKTDEWWKKRGL